MVAEVRWVWALPTCLLTEPTKPAVQVMFGTREQAEKWLDMAGERERSVTEKWELRQIVIDIEG